MNKKVAEMWVKALRSGEFVQGQSSLRPEEGTYCCLGVLCALYMKKNPDSGAEWYCDDHGEYDFVLSNVSNSTYPPAEVAEWADISSAEIEDLVLMNDRGDTFDEIADVIEEEAKKE